MGKGRWNNETSEMSESRRDFRRSISGEALPFFTFAYFVLFVVQ
jgi:hypothetical protein